MIKKSIKQRLMEHFLSKPSDRLRVREIEKKLKIPLPSVIRYCRELADENILATQDIGKIHLYTANRTSQDYVFEKKIYNLKILHESGLIEYLKQEQSNPGIVLFGSYAKGEDAEDSDIDLYIESKAKSELGLEKYEKLLRKKIQIIRAASLKEIGNPHLANNIINGITLSGFIEVLE